MATLENAHLPSQHIAMIDLSKQHQRNVATNTHQHLVRSMVQIRINWCSPKTVQDCETVSGEHSIKYVE